MAKRDKADALARWMAIPDELKRVSRGLSKKELDEGTGPDRMSTRETVHHLVEANLIASNIVISALARSGSPFDWTWVYPGGAWMSRMGYSTVPIGPAISTLRSLTRHFAAILSALDDGLDRTVELWDSPEAPHYKKTVGQILLDEVNHAREHLAALPARRARRRVRPARRSGRVS